MENIGIVISNICTNAGTERAVANLANALSELTSNNVFIISVYSSENEEPFYSLHNKVNVIHLKYPLVNNTIKRMSVYRGLFKDLAYICRDKKITVLIGTSHAYNAVISAFKRPIKIGCEHINYDACPKAFRIIRKIAYRNLDNVVLLTNDDRKHYGFLGEKKTIVIPNIRSFKPEVTAALRNKEIITVGRLNHQKGYDILLSFADKLYKKIPDWQITIYGDGEMKDYLAREIKEKGLNDFIIINKPVKNIQEKMLESSIYLMTSRNEGLPMVLLEAQACGLPIISFNCPEGPKDIIEDGVDGYLIPAGDTESMLSRIVQVAESVEVRRKLGQAARIHSEEYSKETITWKWVHLIDEIKKSRR